MMKKYVHFLDVDNASRTYTDILRAHTYMYKALNGISQKAFAKRSATIITITLIVRCLFRHRRPFGEKE